MAYPEFLNIHPYMSEKGDPVMYSLYAVLVHAGYSCHAGHYYCYVKVSPGRAPGTRCGLGAGGCSGVPVVCRKEGAQQMCVVWSTGRGYRLRSGIVEILSSRVPLPALGCLWVLGSGALPAGAVPAALRARRSPGTA